MNKLLQTVLLAGALSSSPVQATEATILEIPQVCDAFKMQTETIIFCETPRDLPKMDFISKGNIQYTLSGDTPRLLANSFGLGDGLHERQLSPNGSIKTFLVDGPEVKISSDGSYGILGITFDCIKRDRIDILQCSSKQDVPFLEYLATLNDKMSLSLNGIEEDPLVFSNYLYKDPTTKM